MPRLIRRSVPAAIHRIDLRLFRKISETFHPFGDAVLPRLSGAANYSRLWIGCAAAMMAIGGRRGRRAAIRGVIAIGASSFVSNLPAKLLFRRQRPQLTVPLARRLARLPTSTSFPSGHAASAFAFATGTYVEKPSLAAGLLPLAGAVAYSRVYTGVHYPSDVVAGAAIGTGIALITRHLWPPAATEPARLRPATSAVNRPALGPGGAGLFVVVNPAAGTIPRRDVVNQLRSDLPAAEVHVLAENEDLGTAVRKSHTARVLGVAGGDGSVSVAAVTAVEADLPLLVIPTGTLNHFARDLGMETVDQAVAAARDPRPVEVDVGSIAGRVFVNTASIGAYVDLVETRQRLESRAGRWPSALFALIDMLRRSSPLEVEVDGDRYLTWMVFFGNCAYTPEGFLPSARTRLDDGRVDLRMVDGSRPWARARLIWAVLTGTLARTPVYRATVAEPPITVRSLRGPMPLSHDGETFPGPEEFVVDKLDRRLVVLAPPERSGWRDQPAR